MENSITLGTEQNWSYRTLRCQLLSKEVNLPTENRRKQRIRGAAFPELKYLQELVREELAKEGQFILPELETFDFIREGRNIAFCGNPGTGKTHLSMVLGIKACLERYTVFLHPYHIY